MAYFRLRVLSAGGVSASVTAGVMKMRSLAMLQV
jgi:hypothetical protein